MFQVFASAHCCHSIVFAGKVQGEASQVKSVYSYSCLLPCKTYAVPFLIFDCAVLEAIEAAFRANPRIHQPSAVLSEAWFASIRSGLLIQISTLEHVGRQYSVVLRQEPSLAEFCIMQNSS